MPLRTILAFPDPGLQTVSMPVTRFDEALRDLGRDLVDTMRAAPGVGITAAHVGIFTQLAVIELDRRSGPSFFANPLILWASAETATFQEGSVSMPGATETVTRPRAIRLGYHTLEGEKQERDVDGFFAICLQHEIDQLNGVFWLQRLSRLKRERLVRKWEKSRG